jgi:hypothetical protein
MKQEQPYTKNAQLDRFLTNMDNAMADLSTKLDEHAEVHAQILEQTTTTNGKVASIQKWRERMSGAVAVMVFLVPTVLGFMGWMAYEITQFDEYVQEALSAYETP